MDVKQKTPMAPPRLQSHAIGFVFLYRSHLNPHTSKWYTFITVLPFCPIQVVRGLKRAHQQFPPPENWHHKQRDSSPMTAKWYHMIYTRHPREANGIHMRPNVSKGNQRHGRWHNQLRPNTNNTGNQVHLNHSNTGGTPTGCSHVNGQTYSIIRIKSYNSPACSGNHRHPTGTHIQPKEHKRSP